MLIDEIYKEVQSLLNKDQLGYLKPMDFNLFINTSTINIVNKLFADVKSNSRKSNWHLEGKDLARYSERLRQSLEYYSTQNTLESLSKPLRYYLPKDLDFITDLFYGTTRVNKVTKGVFLDLQRNIYAPPSNCSPIFVKEGTRLLVLPNIIDVDLHYIRVPKIAKWTYQEVGSKPMFDQTALDFQDADIPTMLKDDLVNAIFEKATISLRELNLTQLANQEQAQDIQTDNIR